MKITYTLKLKKKKKVFKKARCLKLLKWGSRGRSLGSVWGEGIYQSQPPHHVFVGTVLVLRTPRQVGISLLLNPTTKDRKGKKERCMIQESKKKEK